MNQTVKLMTLDQVQAAVSSAYRLASHHTWTCYAHHPVCVTIDSATTGNMIRHTIVQHLGGQVTPSSQSIHQADSSSPCTLLVRHASLLPEKAIRLPSKTLSLKILM